MPNPASLLLATKPFPLFLYSPHLFPFLFLNSISWIWLAWHHIFHQDQIIPQILGNKLNRINRRIKRRETQFWLLESGVPILYKCRWSNACFNWILRCAVTTHNPQKSAVFPPTRTAFSQAANCILLDCWATIVGSRWRALKTHLAGGWEKRANWCFWFSLNNPFPGSRFTCGLLLPILCDLFNDVPCLWVSWQLCGKAVESYVTHRLPAPSGLATFSLFSPAAGPVASNSDCGCDWLLDFALFSTGLKRVIR